MSLEAFLDELNGRGGDRRASKPLPEAQVATLREVLDRYTSPCPFKVGDLVTARAGMNVKGAGEPHIVLEVFATPIRSHENPGSNTFVGRFDMRVATFPNASNVACFSVESFTFERYTAA